MACKQGIRQPIEAAKVYHHQQRQRDPFRDFWTALVRRIYDAPDGFYRLSNPEQTYYLATVLRGEVFNGGIGQFFDNSSGDFYRETLDALEELGAMRCHALLVAAKLVLFPHAEPPREQAARYEMMPSIPIHRTRHDPIGIWSWSGSATSFTLTPTSCQTGYADMRSTMSLFGFDRWPNQGGRGAWSLDACNNVTVNRHARETAGY
jgi:hypothetical protein